MPAGLSGFHKLLLIPLLLAQFRRSGQGAVGAPRLSRLVGRAARRLVGACARAGPRVARQDVRACRSRTTSCRAAIFAICAFGLIGQAAELWRTQVRLALAARSRRRRCSSPTSSMSPPRAPPSSSWRCCSCCSACGSSAGRARSAPAWSAACWRARLWASSPYLRERVSLAVEQVRTFGTGDAFTAVGLRLEYWKKSLAFVARGAGDRAMAPARSRCCSDAMPPPRATPMLITDNPHNQILTVAIQLGLVGVVALIAMWIAHLALFRAGTLIAWFGLVVVVQNIVGSLFNSLPVRLRPGLALRARRRRRRRDGAAGDARRRQARGARHEHARPPRPARAPAPPGHHAAPPRRCAADHAAHPHHPAGISAGECWTCWCFAAAKRILQGNPDIDGVITMPERPSVRRDARLGSPAVAPLRSRRIDAGRRPPHFLRLAGGAPPGWPRAAAGRDRRLVETPRSSRRGGARAGHPPDHAIAAARDRARPRAGAGDRLPARRARRRSSRRSRLTRSCMPTRSIATSAGPMPAGAACPRACRARAGRGGDRRSRRGRARLSRRSCGRAGPVGPRLDGRLDWPQLAALLGGRAASMSVPTPP